MPSDKQAQEAVNRLKEAILTPDVDLAKQAAQEIVTKGISPMRAIEEGIRGCAGALAEKFDSGEFFLPHLVLAGEAMTEASHILEAALPKGSVASKNVVVIGTVEGDMHSVGKNIVAMMLRTGGFEVHDLGVDVKSNAFVQRAKDVGADVIALSCLMTTTLPYQREVIDDLKSQGLRQRFRVMVGGGPVTKK
ncbi:MAG: cobalamin-dependent protein, partial [Chloroflexota bacterium]|nr:cobalamin-dependent protein [Chloroflexota bacterium]